MLTASKTLPPEAEPVSSEPADVLNFRRTIDSLEQENAWLRELLRRVTSDK
jgi:hypothetical protein